MNDVTTATVESSEIVRSPNDLYRDGLELIVTAVHSQLKEHCVNGKKVTRTALCNLLSLSDDHDVVMSLVLKDLKLSGFKSWPGKFGGIGAIDDVRAPKVKGAPRVIDPSRIDAAFVKQLEAALEAMVPQKNGDKGISRAEIAQALGQPGSKMENEISKVFATTLLEGRFYSQKGPKGGILRGTKPQAATAPTLTVQTEGTTSETVTETGTQAPAEAPTPELTAPEAPQEPLMTMESADAEPAEAPKTSAPAPKPNKKSGGKNKSKNGRANASA